MNPNWLLKHFEQISAVPDSVSRMPQFYLEYCNHEVQITQTPSGKLMPKKSQMASGQSQDPLPESSVRIAQMPSVKSAATFPLKKRLIQWAEAALQSVSGGR